MHTNEKLNAIIEEMQHNRLMRRVHRTANNRKREQYWIGFLEGALSSGRIEVGEPEALVAEAEKFVEFFEDPDARDLVLDIQSGSFDNEAQLFEEIEFVASEAKAAIDGDSQFSEKDELNCFLGFCAGVICDGIIFEAEARAMLQRFERSPILSKSSTFSMLHRSLKMAFEDNALSSDEAEDIRHWISKLVGDGYTDTGVANIGSTATLDLPLVPATQIHFAGFRFVLTGPMSMGPRKFVTTEIERMGGICDKRTTKSTNYVVLSTNASRDWKATHFGNKIEYARELIDKGCDISFVSEVDLKLAIECV